MATLDTKTRDCDIVIRKKSYPKDFENTLVNYLKQNTIEYSYIIHSNDTNELGELEDLHYHIVCTFRGTKRSSGGYEGKRLATYLNEIVNLGFDNPFGIQIDKLGNKSLALQYLIHKNQLEKTPHSIDEIKTSIPREELETIINCDVNLYTLDYYANLVLNFDDFFKMVLTLPKDVYKRDRNIILDFWKAKDKFVDRYKRKV